VPSTTCPTGQRHGQRCVRARASYAASATSVVSGVQSPPAPPAGAPPRIGLEAYMAPCWGVEEGSVGGGRVVTVTTDRRTTKSGKGRRRAVGERGDVVGRGKGGEGDEREEGGEVGATRRAEAVVSLGPGESRRVRKTGCFGDGGAEMMGSSGACRTTYILSGGPSAPRGGRRPGARRRRHNGSASPAGHAPAHAPPPARPPAQPPSLPNTGGEITAHSRGTGRASDSASARPTEWRRIEDQRTPRRRTCPRVPPGPHIGTCHPPHPARDCRQWPLRELQRHASLGDVMHVTLPHGGAPPGARPRRPKHVTRQRAVAQNARWPAGHSTSSRSLRAVAAAGKTGAHARRAAPRSHYGCEDRPRAQRGPATGRVGGRDRLADMVDMRGWRPAGRCPPARHARERRQGAEPGRPSPDFHDVPVQPGFPMPRWGDARDRPSDGRPVRQGPSEEPQARSAAPPSFATPRDGVQRPVSGGAPMAPVSLAHGPTCRVPSTGPPAVLTWPRVAASPKQKGTCPHRPRQPCTLPRHTARIWRLTPRGRLASTRNWFARPRAAAGQSAGPTAWSHRRRQPQRGPDGGVAHSGGGASPQGREVRRPGRQQGLGKHRRR